MLVFASLRNKKSIVFAFGKHLVRCQKLWLMIFFCEWECARNYSLDAERDLQSAHNQMSPNCFQLVCYVSRQLEYNSS